MMTSTETLILDSETIQKSLARVAHEILERNKDIESLALIGIHKGGAHLANRLRKLIQDLSKKEIPLGFLDITLYRDDIGEIGNVAISKGTDILFDVNQKTIILVDDVLYTGRTIRCAIDQIIDFGRPRQIQLAVLIDRGHRELPIKADFIGKNIPTSLQEEVIVRLVEDGEPEDKVMKRPKGGKS
jgi:pyrimidine operon attenuation protein/uracil phosphoribosyltransferase